MLKVIALRTRPVGLYRETRWAEQSSHTIYLAVRIKRMLTNALVQPKNINSSAPRF
jgi:hypothetical protein